MTQALDKICFSQRQRLTFIESIAYWEGAVDRNRVSLAFKVSENHVTKDFRLYKEAFPGNLQYDESHRAYRPSRRFKPFIGQGSAEEYLALLRAHVEQNNGNSIPMPEYIQADITPSPQSIVSTPILNAFTRAIAGGTGLNIQYQSMSSTKPKSRKIWPHALVFGGTRWHARVYDAEHQTWIDVVLQRVLSAKPIIDLHPALGLKDKQWETKISIDVIPRRTLTVDQANVVAKEFGMSKTVDGWAWEVKLRECLVGYFIYLYRLDVKDDIHRRIELKLPDISDRYLSSMN
ncbi:conserved hypothetical protein [Ricinus communis]|uniref:Uncharacterized protein n=1 Tax=Ricinus communis TaxID=3988 RepID=B9T8U3_RICCO|nr:conserved hypothetical protein [Ricinus communis]